MESIDRKELYQKFQEAFPIESLKEMSLEKYTNLKREDSFCYWLEFKTMQLGSIKGGSASKFGIYRYVNKPKEEDVKLQCDENYAWYAKYGKNTAEEAYAVVRSAIVSIAESARNGDFVSIDRNEVLGEAYKWKIAFLYSNESLIPIYKRDMLESVAEKLGMSDSKSKSIPEIQNFLMSKKGNDDLYEFYGRLLEILGPNNEEQNEEDETEDMAAEVNLDSCIRYWLYAPGENAFKWDWCVANNMMCIGWSDMGDLSSYKSLEDVRSKMHEVYPGAESSFVNDGLAAWEFVRVMKCGDVVIAKKGTSIIVGRGVVEGEYVFNPTYGRFCNVRAVKWTNVGEWEASQKCPVKTLTNITDNNGFVSKIESLFAQQYWWLVANPKIWSLATMKNGEVQDYTLYNENGNKRHVFQSFLNAKAGDLVIGYETRPTKQIVALLEIAKESDGKSIWFKKTETLGTPISYSDLKDNNELKNMEFFVNPNGSLFKLTGQEYDAVMDRVRYENPIVTAEKPKYSKQDFLNEVFMKDSDYETLKNLLLRKKNVILQGAPGVGKTFAAKRLAYAILGEKDDDRIMQVQFHQNYSYEDFIMGYKPNEEGGFYMRTGSFYNFCKKAAAAERTDPYFFIIDEINRGNLSKIFGELLMLIENDYRDKPIQLSYRDEMFSVPSNVYIIGMMNTADRSLALIDYALRRRFSFFEMKPGFDADGFKKYLDDLGSEKLNEVVKAVANLNETIADDDSLGSGFCIGHSYFCGIQDVTEGLLKDIVEYDILPTLREYWFDDVTKYNDAENRLKAALK